VKFSKYNHIKHKGLNFIVRISSVYVYQLSAINYFYLTILLAMYTRKWQWNYYESSKLIEPLSNLVYQRKCVMATEELIVRKSLIRTINRLL